MHVDSRASGISDNTMVGKYDGHSNFRQEAGWFRRVYNICYYAGKPLYMCAELNIIFIIFLCEIYRGIHLCPLKIPKEPKSNKIKQKQVLRPV